MTDGREPAGGAAPGGGRQPQHLAVVEVLGALTYGQLRAFEATARAVRHAPDTTAAERMAEFAVAEHAGYRALRDHLATLTDLPPAVMDRQKPRFDDYFDRAPLDGWLRALTFFGVALPLVADFAREIAPTLPAGTAEVVVGALAEREPFERFALGEVADALADGRADPDAAREQVADVLGRALTGFQGAMAETDGLRVLLESGVDGGPAGERLVKDVAITVLEAHRRRMHALGLEDLAG